MALTVGIVDDNELWLTTLRDTIARGAFEVVVAEIAVPAFLEGVRTAKPDVVLVDLRMPPNREDEGIVLAHHLRREYPRLGIVVVSGLEDGLRHQYIESKLRDTDGLPLGFLYKDRLTQAGLHHDLERVANGEAVVDSVIADAAVGSIVRSARTELNEAEDRLMGYMAEGWANDRIAATMSMSSASTDRLSRQAFTKLLGSDDASGNKRVRAVVEWLRRRGEA